jgi:hypothetical protein
MVNHVSTVPAGRGLRPVPASGASALVRRAAGARPSRPQDAPRAAPGGPWAAWRPGARVMGRAGSWPL